MTDPNHILNWRRISPNITLSGQPSEAELADIKALGVTDVLNLGPHDNKGALPDEPGSVARLGLTYHYIPVDFDNPTEADFQEFCAALTALEGKTLHIHCIYNARVSAFVTRRAQEGLGGDGPSLAEMMDGIWRPGGVWARFMGRSTDEALPNRYAGEDY